MFDDYDNPVETQHGKCRDKTELFKTFDACFELARAYVPLQSVHSLFSPEEGLIKGTIFPELAKPYAARHAKR